MAGLEDDTTAATGPRPKKQKTGGFKWKEKKARDDGHDREQPPTGLHRGYRDRSPRRDSYRERSPRDDGDAKAPSHSDNKYRKRSPRREEHRDRDPERLNQRHPDQGEQGVTNGRAGNEDEQRYSGDRPEHHRPANRSDKADDGISKSTAEKFGLPTGKPDKKDKSKKTIKAPVSQEPMIIVNINDRLGTKAAIPCFASDNVKLFKAQVAARIGRQPHEIMLKRQGERPFKDNLTLEDYGVSSGVQLDLEIDTGD